MTNWQNWKPVTEKNKPSHGKKESGITLIVMEETITSTKWTLPQSTQEPVMDTQKDEFMQDHSRKSDQNAKPTPQTGKVDIHAVREGLAMVMDALRVLQGAGVRMTNPRILTSPSGGKILLSPMIEIPGHRIGIAVTEGKIVFTVDGVSVMERLVTEGIKNGK